MRGLGSSLLCSPIAWGLLYAGNVRKWSEMEFLSTYANIYESTHVHYNGKICICVLLINETQVTFTWSEFFVPSCELWQENACTLRHLVNKFTLNVFLQSCELVGVRLDSKHAHFNILSKQVPKTLFYKAANVWELSMYCQPSPAFETD